MANETKAEARPEAALIVGLARRTVEEYTRARRVIEPPPELPERLLAPGAAFVSLHLREGDLRGCIGTTTPTQPNLALEIVRNAIQAATRDPRFEPVRVAELAELVYKVDVLSEPERVARLEDLDPTRYGVIVRQGPFTGLLLPDLPQVRSVEEQVWIACMKAGIYPDGEVELYRFTVDRYEEDERPVGGEAR
jgi:AmmeMemoRadiSam system protein A